MYADITKTFFAFQSLKKLKDCQSYLILPKNWRLVTDRWTDLSIDIIGEEGSDRSYVYHLEFVLHDIRNMENPKKTG